MFAVGAYPWRAIVGIRQASQPLFDGGIDLEPSSVEQVLGSLKTRVPVSKRGRFWESVLTTEEGRSVPSSSSVRSLRAVSPPKR